MTQDDPAERFLFLSDTDREAATSRLRVAGVPYLKRKLESGPANWMRIAATIDAQHPTAALVKLTNNVMRLLLDPSYAAAADELSRRISPIPHVVFVHSSFVDAPIGQASAEIEKEQEHEQEEDEWFGRSSYFEPLSNEKREKVMQLLNRHELGVIPFRTNAELSVLAGQFVDEHRKNLIFRFYVPARKIWAEQTRELLELFKDYLIRSLGMPITRTTHETRGGTTYEFFGAGIRGQEVADRLPRFAQAMTLCVDDPEAAERMLVLQGADAARAGALVTNYRRRVQRIVNDSRQERERKLLEISHQLENDLLAEAPDVDASVIRTVVNQLLPASEGVADLLMLGTAHAAPPPATVMIAPQFISRVEGIVAQNVHGTQNFARDAMRLLEFVQRHGGARTADLSAAVHELEDADGPAERRGSARGRLQGFLAKLAAKTGDKALDAVIAGLKAYVQ